MRSERGFTLLELLLTLTVTTIGLVGLLALHLSVSRGNDGASRSAEAQQISTTTLESLRAQSTADMMLTLTGNAAAVPPQTVTLPTVAGRAGMTYTRTVTVTSVPGASTNLWKIRVVTGWTEDGGSAGAAGGLYDHFIAVEVIRTLEEAL